MLRIIVRVTLLRPALGVRINLCIIVRVTLPRPALGVRVNLCIIIPVTLTRPALAASHCWPRASLPSNTKDARKLSTKLPTAV